MKIVTSYDIYFETKTGDVMRTKLSFTDPDDALKYVQIENGKDTAFGRYFSKTNSRVCYESYEEFLSAQKNAGIEK